MSGGADAMPQAEVAPGRAPRRRVERSARGSAALLAPVALLAVALFPLTRGPFGLQLATLVAVYVVAVAGIDIIVGGAGLLHSGYGIVFGAGAFTVGLLAQHQPGLPVLVSAAAGSVIGAIAATVLGLILARSSGYMFAVLTLAASSTAASVVSQTKFLGGTAGFGAISRNLVGTGDVNAKTLYLVVCAFAITAVVLKAQFGRSATGRGVEALRLVPDVAEASGVELAKLRVKLAALSGVVGGFAGGLYAISQQYVSPDVVGPIFSVNLLVMNVIGGPRVAWAGLPGALIAVALPQEIQSLASYQLIITGAVTAAVALWFRRGVAGTLQDAWWTVVKPLLGGWRWRSRPSDELAARRPAIAPAGEGVAPVLAARKITVSFGGVLALADVDLELRGGEIHALVGPNGAGKTTLVRTISGSVRPRAGVVSLGGEDITSAAPAKRVRRGITRTFQLVSLCDTLTVRENAMLGGHIDASRSLVRDFLHLSSRSREARVQARADGLLRDLGIAHLADEKPARLTSGQQRLAEIARCLMTDAPVILLDEPAAGLSPADRHELAGVIRRLATAGHAVLLIEHDMEFVMALADVVTVLANGRVLAEGTREDVRSDPAVIAAYWGRAATR